MKANKIRLQKGFERVLPYNAVSGEYLIRVETSEYDEGGFCDGVELLLSGGKPTLERIKEIVMGWIDRQTDERILSGHSYQGHLVWLNLENQSNYFRAYVFAMLSQGAILPLTFKLGTNEAPHLETFKTLDELSTFILGAFRHINDTVEAGWRRKYEQIDWSLYEGAL